MEDTAMKRKYMKPEIEVVKIQHQYIICTSPGSLPKNDDEVDDGF
jgi:hypothetical protein